MMTTLQSLLLGTVEGLTEFLPVSSSGHLIMIREWLHINTENGLAFDAIIQLGTILAAYFYFWTDIKRLAIAGWKLLTRQTSSVNEHDRSLVIGIILGTIPAILLGLLLKHAMETTFRSAEIVAYMLLAGSILFVFAERYAKQTRSVPSIAQSWWIGIFQTLALIPGVSRSGATISGGLFLGLRRDMATRFSFLLSLPIITGSGLLEIISVARHGAADFSLFSLIIGFVTSFMFGYICIRWLMTYLKSHSLMAFVWYRCALALIILIVARM